MVYCMISSMIFPAIDLHLVPIAAFDYERVAP